MSDKFKKRLISIIILVLVGIWFGYNIGQGRPFWGNPFVPSTQEQIKDKAHEMVDEAKGVLREKLDDK